jgi:hypothetical protein
MPIKNSNHYLFGLNMDLDWYSLTDYSAMSYAIANADSNLYIVTDCDYHLNQVDIELERLNFTNYKIAFPKGAKASRSGLEKLAPLMFIARYEYSNTQSFDNNGFRDAEMLKSKLTDTHGDPILIMEKPEYRVYKWQKDDFTIIVNSVSKTNTTGLHYMIHSR